jgi:predicted DNA-binding transcriptional regulator YafY
MTRSRLVPDRFRRVWAIVEHIASNPGCGRRELAEHFSLSERQLQADLNVIRMDMSLPLVRRQGYRFLPAPEPPEGRFDFADAQLLALALSHAATEGLASPEHVRALAAKLPDVFPSHLRPVVRRALHAAAGQPADPAQEAVFDVLGQALRCGSQVRLRYSARRRAHLPLEPVVHPEMVVPYLGGWYVIGECQQSRRVMMFRLDTVAEASLVIAATPR